MASEISAEGEPPSPFELDVPAPSVFPTAAELTEKLDEAWNIIQQTSLDPVFRNRLQNPFADEDLLKSLHVEAGQEAVKDIISWRCTDQPDFKAAAFLFNKLVAYYTFQCKALRPELQKIRRDEALLKAAFWRTKRLWFIISYLSDFFSHLDSGPPEREESQIRRMAIQCFLIEVYQKISIRLRMFAFECLDNIRMGDDKHFKSLLQYKALIHSISSNNERFIELEWDMHLRKNCVVRLKRREKYCKSRCLCHFIKNADKRKFEIESFSAGKKNFLSFRNEIFQTTQDFFFSDEGRPVIHLLERECHIALKSMCRIYGSEQEFMKKIADIFEKHLSGTVIVDFNESLGENPTPRHVFTEFLRIWSKVTVLANKGLEETGNERHIVEALTNPFNSLIAEHEELFRIHLEEYFDYVLKDKGAGKPFVKRDGKVLAKRKSLAEEIESAVMLLGKLPNFETFVAMYRNKLVKSIHCEDFSRKNAELLLKPFSNRFLYLDEVAKLKGLMSIITKQWENSTAFTPIISPNSKRPGPRGVCFLGAKVVQRVDWPEEDCMVKMKLPERMRNTTKAYNKFFKLKHKEKLFEYNFSSDRVIITTQLFSKGRRTAELHMTTHQACILEVFQEVDSSSVAQIKEKLKCDSEDGEEGNEACFQEKLFKYLGSLMTKEYPILLKTPEAPDFNMEDVVSLNKGFIATKGKVVLPIP